MFRGAENSLIERGCNPESQLCPVRSSSLEEAASERYVFLDLLCYVSVTDNSIPNITIIFPAMNLIFYALFLKFIEASRPWISVEIAFELSMFQVEGDLACVSGFIPYPKKLSKHIFNFLFITGI